MIKKILTVIFVISTVSCSTQENSERNVNNKGIKLNSIVPFTDDISYNFTDLVYFKERWFLIFRESDSHAFGKDGVINLYTRLDNEIWTLVKTFKVDGIDLRDPKFSVNDDQLMLYLHGSKYVDKELLGFSDYRSVCIEGNNWEDLEEVKLLNSKPLISKIKGNEGWPWRVTWYKHKAYTFGYSSWGFDLYDSTDGLAFNCLNIIPKAFPFRGEATIRVDDKGDFYAVIRSTDLILAKSTDHNKSWQVFDKIQVLSLGGPNFIFYENKMLITGRDSRAMQVVLYSYDLINNNYRKLLTFPSGGDCGYAGMVIKDGELWVSYYSSHDRYKGRHSDIYIKNVKLSDLGL
ncbi:hypothetical protein [Flavobacterium piscis]|uniref:Glutaredoxin-related protein n=1 Tax=Flavobacterium piscis TaxID=1114874 RepID=A0ABU1Y5N7_9FLAO|nr:hypothetical protein [Flavobacterium piscis]MDR7208990.1 glutaredoxin-related protein [Flavobacterium piscis]